LNTIVTDVIGDIALVIVVSSVLGAVARRCGQPVVIGQLLTGVLLGPSVLGRLPGHLTSHLFPHQVLPYLTVLAQVAVAVFMFAVGYEIDLAKLRGRGRTVPLIAASALAVPMGLGMACVLLFRSGFTAVGEVHQGRSFLLFMGVATSITAMPVLAAVVRERGLTGTIAGVTATAAAGSMDVVAWLLLAAALIGSGHSGRFSLPVTLLLAGCFVAFMLPLFFIVTGLALNIGAVGGDGFVLLALILVVAAAGKLGPAYGVSRVCGIGPKESATIAVLLNTRGLTELIALNVGLTDGLIGRQLFSVLVLMALITTMMTGPLLSVIERYRAQEPVVAEHVTNT